MKNTLLICLTIKSNMWKLLPTLI